MSFFLIAIESSCDETAVSVLEFNGDGPGAPFSELRVCAHVVESQNESHAPFGGVVPEVAARDHLAKIHSIAVRALTDAGIARDDLSAVCVTMGPGLIGALMVGVLFARGVARALNIPLLCVNHVDAHLAPALLLSDFSPRADLGKWLPVKESLFPALALTVSGGHCLLSVVESPTVRRIIGQTADDACGEAFDKVARVLGFAYPGGPLVEKHAAQVSASRFRFSSTLQDKTNRYGFSFSGLKTAVLEVVRKETKQHSGKISGAGLDDQLKNEICFAFQEAALGQLEDRVRNALADSQFRSVLVAGGVAANSQFRKRFLELGLPVHFAPGSLCSDNATMIGLQAALVPATDAEGKIQPFARYSQGVFQ